MARGKGRGRRRGSYGMQNYPYAPLSFRLSTWSSARVSPQLMTSGSTNSNPCSEAALINPKIEMETAEARLTHDSTSSQSAGKDPVLEHRVEDGTHFISTGSPSFGAELTLKVEVPQQDDNARPQHQDIAGIDQPPRGSITANPCLKSPLTILKGDRETANPVFESIVEDDVKPSNSQTFQSPRENYVVPQDDHGLEKITATDVLPSSQCLSSAHSLNMTEFARGLQDESDDGRGVVESAPPGHDYVHGHKVKTEDAGLVGTIFRRYGDIISECDVKSPSFLSYFLERLCIVYQTLEEKKLSDLKGPQINDMLDELHLFKTHKLNVGWLLERLEQISETTSSSQEYLKLKEEAERCMESNTSMKREVERQRVHIDLIQKKISTLEKQMVENEAKAKKCTQKAFDIKIRVNTLQNQSLVHGLLELTFTA